MKQVRATATKVLGFFVNPPGQHTLGSGLIVLNDEGLERGIKPRYFEVHSVGERTEVVNDIKPGDIVYVAHGRWSRGIDVGDTKKRNIHSLDPKDILGIYEGEFHESDLSTIS
jgi:hypothetical protein|tara:strand:+ start:1955 stop:2293 length:339 start_codon:yes stop_codon:yes gene_type:complete